MTTSKARVELEWGERGAEALGVRCDLVIVVDVLSFTTTVSLAASRDIAVYPFRSGDHGAAERAAELDALLAGPRGSAVSLSPASMLHARRAMLAAAARRPLAGVASGRELVDLGYDSDVELAEQVAVDAVVPALYDGAFRVAATFS